MQAKNCVSPWDSRVNSHKISAMDDGSAPAQGDDIQPLALPTLSPIPGPYPGPTTSLGAQTTNTNTNKPNEPLDTRPASIFAGRKLLVRFPNFDSAVNPKCLLQSNFVLYIGLQRNCMLGLIS